MVFCPAGLGGYSNSTFAWRWYLPSHLLFQASNNLLEHLAAIITPWVDIIRGCLKVGNCALSMTNSTTSEGWLRKTNFSKLGNDPIQASVRLEAARMHALNYMTTGIREYSQWFRGKDNVVADSLSCKDDQLDEELTQIFCTHCQSQIPLHFEIQPLPSKITLWLTVLLLKLPVKAQFNKKHTRTSLGRGTDGQSTADGLDSWTPSSMTSPAPQGSNLLAPLPWLCTKQDFQDHLMNNWLTAQSQVPSHMYVRPSANTDDPTHPWMTPESLDSFYNGSSDHSKRPTPQRSTRKQSRWQSSPPWQNNNSQNLTAPLSNSQGLGCSLPFNPASISKSPKLNKAKQRS